MVKADNIVVPLIRPVYVLFLLFCPRAITLVFIDCFTDTWQHVEIVVLLLFSARDRGRDGELSKLSVACNQLKAMS